MTSRIEPRDRFFETLCHLPEREIRAGLTVTFTSLIDFTQVEAIRRACQDAGGRKHSYTAFVVKALALALKEFPYANRRVFRRPWPFFTPRLQTFLACDVAVAVERDMPGRESVAYVDVLREADQRALPEITDWLHELANSDATNNRQWREFSDLIRRFPSWISSRLVALPVWFPDMWVKYRGAAALVSSPAKYGVDGVAAAWAWPLGVSFGLVKPRAVVRDGQVVARTTVNLVLNFDRRVMAGAQAARFFNRVVELLENASTELAPAPPAASPQPAPATA